MTPSNVTERTQIFVLLSTVVVTEEAVVEEVAAAAEEAPAKPAKATKAAMLISSGSPGTGEGAITSYKNMLAYMGIEDMGVCALAGADCKSEEKLAEIRAFAKGL